MPNIDPGQRTEGIKRRIGEVIDAWIAAHGGTQADFAAAIGYSVYRVSRLRSGAQAVTLDDVRAFAKIDPERRGILWFGWDLKADPFHVQPTGNVPLRPGPPHTNPRGGLDAAHRQEAKGKRSGRKGA